MVVVLVEPWRLQSAKKDRSALYQPSFLSFNRLTNGPSRVNCSGPLIRWLDSGVRFWGTCVTLFTNPNRGGNEGN